MNAAAHRPDWNGDGSCDLLVREADDVAEDDGLTEVDRKLEQSLLNVVTEGDPVELGVGRVGRGEIPSVDLVWHRGCGTTLLPANIIEEGVASDAPQPAFEAPGLIAGKPASHSEEDFLDEVVRVVRVAGEAIGEVVDLPSVDTGDLFPCERYGLHQWETYF
jgi:hypothetical protein